MRRKLTKKFSNFWKGNHPDPLDYPLDSDGKDHVSRENGRYKSRK